MSSRSVLGETQNTVAPPPTRTQTRKKRKQTFVTQREEPHEEVEDSSLQPGRELDPSPPSPKSPRSSNWDEAAALKVHSISDTDKIGSVSGDSLASTSLSVSSSSGSSSVKDEVKKLIPVSSSDSSFEEFTFLSYGGETLSRKWSRFLFLKRAHFSAFVAFFNHATSIINIIISDDFSRLP